MEPDRSMTRTVVLIDGRSGAGKTSLGQVVAAAIGAELVSLDDLYPGWDGLEAGSRMVHEQVLRAVDPGWAGWDWASGREAGWHPLDPDRSIVVEGCGAISRASRPLADVAIWVEAPEAVRRRRALAREPGFAPHWQRWADQERAHALREHPRALADVIVDTRAS
jgi:uridine kinase